MKTVIALHTGTGNSLYIAKRIPDAEIHFIDEFLSGNYVLPEDTDRLGIIFPVYCWGLPYPVRAFIRECLAKRDNSSLGYVFGLATCGAFPLYTLYDLSASLSDAGIALSYGRSFKLPDAYLPLQKKAVDEGTAKAAAEAIESCLSETVADIMNETIRIPRRGPGWRLVRALSSAGMKPRENKTLRVNSRCTGCGICASVCPMGNISIEDGHPSYADNCISCFACYHRCPENAIDYKGASGQYRGLVETSELMRKGR